MKRVPRGNFITKYKDKNYIFFSFHWEIKCMDYALSLRSVSHFTRFTRDPLHFIPNENEKHVLQSLIARTSQVFTY